MPDIPPHIFWPGFIFGLLGMAIGASFTILYFAQSGDGPQIVPDHYQKSVEYDDYYQARQHSLELGWSVDIELRGDRGRLDLRDADGDPIDGAEGTLTFYRPSLAEPVAEVQLADVDDRPGHYAFDDRTDKSGYWDVAVDIDYGDDTFIETIRKDVPRS